MNEIISKEDRAGQARAILTAMKTKGVEELGVFAKILSSCKALMSLAGKKILETIGELRPMFD